MCYVVTTPQWEFDQARHRGVNPTYSRSTSEGNNGVGVKADTLCSTRATVKVNTIGPASLWRENEVGDCWGQEDHFNTCCEMGFCYVFSCNHHSSVNKCSLYRFPKDDVKRKLWERLCR